MLAIIISKIFLFSGSGIRFVNSIPKHKSLHTISTMIWFLLSHHVGKQHFWIWRWENKGHDFFNLIKNASLDKIYDLQCHIHEKVNHYKYPFLNLIVRW